jgi:hypothetical protein
MINGQTVGIFLYATSNEQQSAESQTSGTTSVSVPLLVQISQS